MRSFGEDLVLNRLQVAIIGAGPIGLEAALQASEAGFAVSLFEKKSIAQNLRDWGHIKLFTPFGMNASAVGIEMLQQAGYELPSRETLLTGREFADVYLLRLADLLRDRIEVCEDTNIIAVSRGDLLKGEAIGNRSEHHKFRLLLEHEQTERIVWADYVLDFRECILIIIGWGREGLLVLENGRCLRKLIMNFPI